MVDRRKGQHGTSVLAFLNHHRLAHTPEHYAFAHEYLNGADGELRERVDGAVDGGVRLTEDQVQKLMPVGTAHPIAPQLDHLTLRVLDVVGDAMSMSTDLNRELVMASATLLEAPTSEVGRMISAMMLRAEQAEASFAEAGQRARAIRAELAALQTSGQRDPLTGLMNAAGLQTMLAADTVREPACLSLVDIDRLRAVNESHSPAVGDRLLTVVARTLTEQCSGQLVARWEGGTFAILMEGTDLKTAADIVSDACAAIGAREMKVRENDQPLGRIMLSAGVVAMRSRAPAELLEAAQTQLHRAKQHGRDQVAVEGIVIGVSATG